MDYNLRPAEVTRKSGKESFHHSGQSLDFGVLSFWQWSASDLLSNATRGILAEFLVARALGSAGKVRKEWDAYDAVTESGIRVEVKSAAYLQSWHQKRHSRIEFDIRPTHAYEAKTNLLAKERQCQADAYVFCLLGHKDRTTVDPLDLVQWRFFVISTKLLNAGLGEQKSVGLSRLQQLDVEETDYEGLKETVERAATEKR